MELAMKARIQWVDGAMFLGESGSGHVVVMDGPPENGGRNLGVRPMEMLLLGLDNAGPQGAAQWLAQLRRR